MSSASERCSRAAGSNATINTAPGRSVEATESSRSRPVNLTPVTLSTSMVITSVICRTVPIPTSGATFGFADATGRDSRRVAAMPTPITARTVSNNASGMPLGSDSASATEPNFSARRCSPPLLFSRDDHGGQSRARRSPSCEPRQAVIDGAWRAIGPGVEVLSGDDGGPLRRTVKRIIDPLVLRLRSNTQYSAPFVDAAVASAMHELIVGNGPALRAAAAWFEVLKRERRRLRITTGNAQELYFPGLLRARRHQGRALGRGSRSGDDRAARHS